jgi:hypothetical protein
MVRSEGMMTQATSPSPHHMFIAVTPYHTVDSRLQKPQARYEQYTRRQIASFLFFFEFVQHPYSGSASTESTSVYPCS